MDGVWVGKDRQFILRHCSVISILSSEGSFLRYFDRDTMEDLFPFNVTQKYIVGEILGKGTTSVVRKGYKDVDGEIKTYALKTILRRDDYSLPTDAKVEVKIMASLRHPCILRLYEVLTSEKSVTIVMERASGGELFHAVVDDLNANHFHANIISEEVTKAYFYQIVHCVNYLHQRKICHRDLKLENILIGDEKRGNVSILKVADFGLSKSSKDRQGHLKTYVGTPVYMAPEISRLESGQQRYPPYSLKVDCWSLGVILYTMLCGRRPFASGADLHTNIKVKVKVSAAAKNLVKKLLDVNPETRWGTEQVLGHEWFIEDEAAVSVAKAVMFGSNDKRQNFDEE